MALLRSVHAHARILEVDIGEALKMPGVVCGLTGEDAGRMSEPLRSLIPIPVQLDAYCLAYGKVTHVGEPVAAILATSRYLAEDALEKIRVEYEPLPATVDPEAAMEADAPLLFESMGTNVMWQDRFDYGDVDEAFGRAARVLKKRFYIQRYSSTALETFGCTAIYDDHREQLTIWSNDQRPGQAMPIVAHSLGLTHSQIRFVTPGRGRRLRQQAQGPLPDHRRAAVQAERRQAGALPGGPPREPHGADPRLQRRHGPGGGAG